MLLGDMSAAELKKHQRKQKKAQHKAAAQAAEEEKEKKGVCLIYRSWPLKLGLQ